MPVFLPEATAASQASLPRSPLSSPVDAPLVGGAISDLERQARLMRVHCMTSGAGNSPTRSRSGSTRNAPAPAPTPRQLRAAARPRLRRRARASPPSSPPLQTARIASAASRIEMRRPDRRARRLAADRLRSRARRIAAAGIGLVATAPEQRGRGLAQRVVEHCVAEATSERARARAHVRRAHAALRAARIRARRARAHHADRARAASRARAHRCGAASRLPRACSHCSRAMRSRVERSAADFARVLAVPETHLYVLEGTTTGRSRYCVEGKGRDLRGVVHEWAGEPEHVRALLRGIAASAAHRSGCSRPRSPTRPLEGEHALGALALFRILRPERFGTADAAELLGDERRPARAALLPLGPRLGLTALGRAAAAVAVALAAPPQSDARGARRLRADRRRRADLGAEHVRHAHAATSRRRVAQVADAAPRPAPALVRIAVDTPRDARGAGRDPRRARARATWSSTCRRTTGSPSASRRTSTRSATTPATSTTTSEAKPVARQGEAHRRRRAARTTARCASA